MHAQRFMWNVVAAILLIGASGTQAQRSTDFSLLVVPERLNLVQVGFDLLAMRPTALVAYRPDTGGYAPVLHAWTGTEWSLISWDDFRSGRFLVRQPSLIVLVGDDATLPGMMLAAAQWGPEVLRVNSNRPDEFLNALGPQLGFTSAEFRWFARRYNMQIEGQEAASADRRSWYDRMSDQRRPPARRQRGTPISALPLLDLEDRRSTPVSAIEPVTVKPVSVEPGPVVAPRVEPLPVDSPVGSPRPAPVLRPQPAPAPMMIPAVEDGIK